MFGSRNNSAVVGLDIEAGSVAATEVSDDGTLQRTGIVPLAPGVAREGEVLDAEALGFVLKDLFAQFKLSRNVRVGIGNQRVIVRTLRLPRLKNDDEIDAAVRFQAAEKIPMPLDQAVLEWEQVEQSQEAAELGQMDVVVVAARRETVSGITAAVKAAGLKPVGIDVAAFGMIRALRGDTPMPPPPGYEERGDAVAPALPARLVCNLGDVTNLAVARGNTCLFTRISPFGVEGIAQRLAERRGLTLEHSRQWLTHVGLEAPVETIEGDPAIVAAARDILTGGAEKLAGELRVSLDFFGTQEGAVAVEEIVISGAGSAIPGMPEALQRQLGYQLRVGHPPALAGMAPADEARLTLPYGLALAE